MKGGSEKLDWPAIFSGTHHTIDNNGVVIFSLPNGGTIRDTGSKLYFSCDEATERAAVLYGLARFGKNILLKGNTIERKNGEVAFSESINYGLTEEEHGGWFWDSGLGKEISLSAKSLPGIELSV